MAEPTIENLQAIIEDNNTHITKMGQALKPFADRYGVKGNMVQQVQELTKRLEQAEKTKNEALEADVARLTDALVEQEARADKLEAQLKAANGRNAQHVEALMELRGDVRTLTDELKKAKAKCVELEAKVVPRLAMPR